MNPHFSFFSPYQTNIITIVGIIGIIITSLGVGKEKEKMKMKKKNEGHLLTYQD